jgi:hypothetical protein
VSSEDCGCLRAWQGWQGLAFAWVRSTVRSPARLGLTMRWGANGSERARTLP